MIGGELDNKQFRVFALPQWRKNLFAVLTYLCTWVIDGNLAYAHIKANFTVTF